MRYRRLSRYAVAYDVTNDRERTRTAKALSGYCSRVQKSLFECELATSSLHRLHRALDDLALKTGFVYLYPLNEQKKRIPVGTYPDEPADSGHSFLV